MRERRAEQLAQYAVDALIEEVSLTPKPGLVDLLGSNSHIDMDWNLLVHSAESLYPTFLKIAQSSFAKPINQAMRESIAKIGRAGEAEMYLQTGGVNTHKGAIWILGLMISVMVSAEVICNKDIERFLMACGQLASYKDRNYEAKNLTKGEVLRKKYHIRSAAVEAAEGFPTLRQMLVRGISYRHDDEARRKEWLIELISVVEDTCVISRSSITTLRSFQQMARRTLAVKCRSEKADAYKALCNFALKHNISPGGSADLLSGLIFLEKTGWLESNINH